VPLPLTKREARERKLNPGDRRWILYRLRRISRAEALRRSPSLASGGSKHFYECRDFDPVARRCTVYDTRPPACSGYPWYGRDPRPTDLDYLERCAFNSTGGVPVALGRR
jgi:Fe-S-cluster containining protein